MLVDENSLTARKIVIDALGIHYPGGGRTATLNTFEGILALNKHSHFLFFLTQPEPSLQRADRNIEQIISPTKNRILVRIWAQLAILYYSSGCSLIHFAKNLGVPVSPCPYIVTVYDLTTLLYPDLFPALDVWYWRTIERKTLHGAAKVIAISQNTAQDLKALYDLPDDKIRVIYPAIGDHFKPVPEHQAQEILRTYHLPENYFIHVGRIDKKKNLTLLVRAFHRFKLSTARNTKLVLVGEVYPKSPDPELAPTIEALGLRNEIIFTGRVPDAHLPALYTHAQVTLFPSVHEGFGLAPIEAMACGSPVIGHRAGAFAEAAGEAALIIDGINEENLAAAMIDISENTQLRSEYIARGFERARLFRKEITARKTLDLYSEITET